MKPEAPTTCRSCRRPIYWFTTRKGKKMPVDFNDASEADVAIGNKLFDFHRHTSHFDTCPNADQHRRSR